MFQLLDEGKSHYDLLIMGISADIGITSWMFKRKITTVPTITG